MSHGLRTKKETGMNIKGLVGLRGPFGRVLACFLAVSVLFTSLPSSLFAADSKASVSSSVKVTRRLRYTGTGWGWITPVIFAGTRVFEAATMDDATTEERFEHATLWAKNPRFWGAVAADMTSVYLAQLVVSALPFGPFIANSITCLVGFGVFEGVYSGFENVDWGTKAYQSLILTAVEMGVAALGLPLGGFLPILASFAVCMFLDSFDGFDGSEEDDEAYIANAENADMSSSEISVDEEVYSAPSTAAAINDDRRNAYEKFISSTKAGNQRAAKSAYDTYVGASSALSDSKREAELSNGN
jgi:hypothetical protein